MKDAINTRLQSQATSFDDERYQKPVPSYDKYTNNDGNYVEKYCNIYTLCFNKIAFKNKYLNILLPIELTFWRYQRLFLLANSFRS